MRRNDADGLDCERFGGILRKHGDEDVNDDLGFGLIGGSHFDENVAGLERDFGVVAVDYWRQRADNPL